MAESKNNTKNSSFMGGLLYLSFSLVFFAGLIISPTFVPWGLDRFSTNGIILFGVSLFVCGFIIQRQREKKIEKETNEKFSELERRIETLENANNPK